MNSQLKCASCSEIFDKNDYMKRHPFLVACACVGKFLCHECNLKMIEKMNEEEEEGCPACSPENTGKVCDKCYAEWLDKFRETFDGKKGKEEWEAFIVSSIRKNTANFL